MELVGEIKGLRTRQKTCQLSVIEYNTAYYRKTGNFRVRSLVYHMKNFTSGQDILFMDVTLEWLHSFHEYLTRRVSHNTAKNYMKILRARLKDAYISDIITINPFDKFVMPHELETKRTMLDTEEVQKLVNTPFPSHPHVRLVFLFSCFTGLRISDCEALKWDDITVETDKSGKRISMLNIRPIKTKSTSGKILKVPLTDSAVAILDEIRKENNRSEEVFSRFPATRNARNLLKLWVARAGIKKNVYFHVARHTFATISLTYGMDIYTVSKLLGHVNLRHTEIYAKIVDEKKRQEIQKLPTLQKS
jgi:integrase